jgi:predicted DNA-binding transcriptional regulator YafY
VKQELAPYVLTKPIHASQKLIKTAANGDITLELCVVNNYELRSELLGLGPQLMVMEPQSLRKEMQAMYEQGMKAYYNKSQLRKKSNE